MDGLAALSLRPSVLNAAFFSASDASPGDAAEATVLRVEASGATLELSPGLKAHVPLLHLSDTGGARAAKRLKAGARVQCRVLTVDAKRKRLVCTLKPSLVACKHPPLCTADDAVPGRVAQGWVTGVQPYGIFVALFGTLKGLVHAKHLGLSPGQTPQDAHAVGQVVTVTVLRVGTDGLLDLALGRHVDPAATQQAQATSLAPLQVIDTATVTSHGRDGRAGVEVSLPGGGTGFVEEGHLADDPSEATALLQLLTPGASLGPLLVLSAGSLATGPVLTHKPLLLSAAAAGTLPCSVSDTSPGQLLFGYVVNVTELGAFVRFGDRLTGLAPLSHLSDCFCPCRPRPSLRAAPCWPE